MRRCRGRRSTAAKATSALSLVRTRGRAPAGCFIQVSMHAHRRHLKSSFAASRGMTEADNEGSGS